MVPAEKRTDPPVLKERELGSFRTWPGWAHHTCWPGEAALSGVRWTGVGSTRPGPLSQWVHSPLQAYCISTGSWQHHKGSGGDWAVPPDTGVGSNPPTWVGRPTAASRGRHLSRAWGLGAPTAQHIAPRWEAGHCCLLTLQYFMGLRFLAGPPGWPRGQQSLPVDHSSA